MVIDTDRCFYFHLGLPCGNRTIQKNPHDFNPSGSFTYDFFLMNRPLHFRSNMQTYPSDFVSPAAQRKVVICCFFLGPNVQTPLLDFLLAQTFSPWPGPTLPLRPGEGGGLDAPGQQVAGWKSSLQNS